jgi:polyhydroxybutyrate depolymerase
MRTGTLRLLIWLAAPLLAALLAACRASASPHPTPAPTEIPVTPAAVSDAPPRPSAGCHGAAALSPGASAQTIEVGGDERTYRRYLPDDGRQGPRPIVINLHGLSSNIQQQVAITGFELLAAAEKFIVLTPQGEGQIPGWAVTASGSNPDVAFIQAMLDDVEAAACVDTARVYAAGLSNGAILSSLLACLLADRVAAVGLVSGILHPANCAPARPVPAIVFWGLKDVVLPFCGGVGPVISALLQGRPLAFAPPPTCPPADDRGFPPVEQVVAAWAATDGCASTPSVVAVGDEVEERIYAGCGGGSSLRFFVVADGGHTWPGSAVMAALSASPAATIIGHTTDEIDATRLIWTFFKQYALVGPSP